MYNIDIHDSKIITTTCTYISFWGAKKKKKMEIKGKCQHIYLASHDHRPQCLFPSSSSFFALFAALCHSINGECTLLCFVNGLRIYIARVSSWRLCHEVAHPKKVVAHQIAPRLHIIKHLAEKNQFSKQLVLNLIRIIINIGLLKSTSIVPHQM